MCDLNGTQHKKYKIIKVVKRIYAWNIGIAFACKLYYTGKRRGQLQYKHFFNILCCMLLTILWPIDSMLWPLYNNIQIQWYDLIWQGIGHSAHLSNRKFYVLKSQQITDIGGTIRLRFLGIFAIISAYYRWVESKTGRHDIASAYGSK